MFSSFIRLFRYSQVALAVLEIGTVGSETEEEMAPQPSDAEGLRPPRPVIGPSACPFRRIISQRGTAFAPPRVRFLKKESYGEQRLQRQHPAGAARNVRRRESAAKAEQLRTDMADDSDDFEDDDDAEDLDDEADEEDEGSI